MPVLGRRRQKNSFEFEASLVCGVCLENQRSQKPLAPSVDDSVGYLVSHFAYYLAICMKAEADFKYAKKATGSAVNKGRDRLYNKGGEGEESPCKQSGKSESCLHNIESTLFS